MKTPSPFPDRPVTLTTIARKLPRKTILCKGIKFRLYSVSWLSHLCLRSPKTITKLERLGVLPTPIFQLRDTYRWYTAAEIHIYQKLILASGMRKGKYVGEKRSLWLKRNAHDAKARLVSLMKDRIGDFPTSLKAEEEILERVSKCKIHKLSNDQILSLLK